jgi:TatD DNase family protein
MLYDIHCHLDKLSDVSGALQRAKDVGVKLILVNGLNPSHNREVIEFVKQDDILRAALGLYPNDALELSQKEIDEELQFIKKHKPLAIGEIGLDYHWDDEHKEEMKQTFRKCLQVAQKIDRPVIIHSRKAEEDVLDILDEFNVTADLHCFSGNLKLAKRGANAKHYFSIPANIVTSTHFQRLVEETPLKLLLLETDAPYLGPDKDAENEPANVVGTIKKIAEIKGLDVSECEKQLWLNQKRFLA